MPVPELKLQALVQELAARLDIESAVGELAGDISAHDDPNTRDIDALAHEWLGILRNKAPTVYACIWANDRPDRTPRLVEEDGSGCPFGDGIISRVRMAFQRRTSSRWPVPPGPLRNQGGRNAFLYFAEGPEFPIAVIAISRGEQSADSIVQFAARYTATRLIDQLAPGAHMRGYRDMAARVSELAGMSVSLAEMKCGELLGDQLSADEESLKRLSEIAEHLREAQEAFDRARVFGMPWLPGEGRDTELSTELATTAEWVNAATGQDVIRDMDIDMCNRSSIGTVFTSPTRLHYALRGLLMGSWLLTKRQQLRLRLDCEKPGFRIEGRECRAFKASRGADIGKIICQPDIFLRGTDDYHVDRIIGLPLAWHLVQEMAGRISARLTEARRLRLDVSFDRAGRNGR
jgi:hypothetical protein